jgi:hypothetical protein
MAGWCQGISGAVPHMFVLYQTKSAGQQEASATGWQYAASAEPLYALHVQIQRPVSFQVLQLLALFETKPTASGPRELKRNNLMHAWDTAGTAATAAAQIKILQEQQQQQ